ncbi:MAG: oxidoreductase FAD/NAD(P)-binding domain-containing protein [Candidatus Berkelbacteria bacterium Licking1014_7]|uniref:Oxidoreductase FAD/NAD(P)-binding domain-containing protein n=1 Tax=Candidatus Berkelbacteria bacterium Licking1014_7 TaxID=2017147 RepID=A0A554LJG2_9BACT|nr:MAG: oxidoreductase FAD/NAD(P)-binding domain-containing protein [Candidatus Berkelbacteria bacterium Licking1014_7]
MLNPYLPQTVKIIDTFQETPTIKRIDFRVNFSPALLTKKMTFVPGQFILAGVWGAGEAPFGLTNSPYNRKRWQIMVRNTGGRVTSSLHRLKPGDTMTMRGPYGNGFPLQKMTNMDIVAMAGGCGIPPIASLIEFITVNRNNFSKVYLVYGAGSPEEFAGKSRFTHWRNKKIEVILTIDKPQKGWAGRVGFVSEHINNLSFDAQKTYVAMCGPGPMFAGTAAAFLQLGVADQRIYLSAERKMSCGIGKCQHCTCGKHYVCLDGPVFSWNQIKDMHD